MTRKEYLDARYKAAVASKTCPQCRARPSIEGKTRCQPCTQRQSELYRKRNPNLCTECKRVQAKPRHTRCEPCLEKLREYARRNKKITYRPLDEWNDLPSTRILRHLRHFDWVSSGDFCDALTIADAERDSFKQSLFRMVKRGTVQRRTVRTFRGEQYEYRLTPGVSVTPPQDLSVCSDEEAA